MNDQEASARVAAIEVLVATRDQWQISQRCGGFEADKQVAAMDTALAAALRGFGLDASRFYTDGGSLNVAKVKAALTRPDEYAGLYLSTPADGGDARDAARYRWLRELCERPWPVNSPEMFRLSLVERGTLDGFLDRAISGGEDA